MKIRQMGPYLLVAAICSGLLPAQMTITGTITGTVLDPSGQVVAGAKVVLTSPKTGDSRSAVANEVGVFSLNAVQPDTYTHPRLPRRFLSRPSSDWSRQLSLRQQPGR